MSPFTTLTDWILGLTLLLSALGILIVRKPIYASLCFLVTLLSLAGFFIQLSAEFIAAAQILVYAGAILVIFIFVIVLFQDAHQQMARYEPKSKPILLFFALGSAFLTLFVLGTAFLNLPSSKQSLPESFGSVQSLGHALYVDFFFPFEAVVLLFLVAVIGALYTAKKGT